MDDQNGHVIDGTARARQWRRSRSEAPAGDEADGRPRSDAPKNIAGSLLVPAEMLSRAPVVDKPANGHAATRTSGAVANDSTSTSVDERIHRNPFLARDAECAESRSKSSRRRGTAIALAGSIRSYATRLSSALRPVPRLLAGWASWRLALVLGTVGAAAAIVVVIAGGSGPGHRVSTGKVPALASAPRKQALTIADEPFPQRTASSDHVIHRARRGHKNRIIRTHRRSHIATKPVVVAARYTPTTSNSGSYTPSASTPSYASSGSGSVAAQSASRSAGGTTSSSSTSGSSQPAFGQNGTLGPGRGAPGTQ
jgi:hypothetical protein